MSLEDNAIGQVYMVLLTI